MDAIILYAYRRNFDVQKAERYFKERGVRLQVADMKKHPPGVKELRLFAQRAGLHNIIDKDNKRYKESAIAYMAGEESILSGLLREPELLRSPILRMGQKITVGYRPDIWAEWLKEQKKDSPR
jgi:arsenate reductase